MDQNQIDKLTELKKLYESGVLTKEEMEAEKAKVLNPQTSSTSSPTPQPAKNSRTKWYWIGGVAIVIIIGVVIANIRATHVSYYPEYSETDEDTVITVDNGTEEVRTSAEESTGEESTESGEWAGRTIIQGGMYRLCMTSAIIDLASDGGGRYHGTINVGAGNDFGDDSYGSLEADITATESGNKLVIKVSTTYPHAGSDGDVFSDATNHKPIQNNSTIFEITNDGGSYSVRPIGNMKEYFDGIADETTVSTGNI